MNTREILLRPMTLNEFEPLVGRDFAVDTSPREVEITLIEASPLPDCGQLDRPPFILIFRSRPEVMLVDGIYAMRCKDFGPELVGLSSLMAPLRSEPGYYYQAVFN